ncbi:hypothetical protein AgCh_016515 [Apium graveolens]
MQKEHPKFKRKGDDLFVEHSLSPTEALFGFQFTLTCLDGRQLLIKSQPGEVIKPDSEELLIIKTGESLLDALKEHVKENHEYDVPEVIALSIVGGSLPYLEWLKENARD